MKCIKLTYKSPMFGSVYCEELVDELDNRIDLGTYGALQLYNRGDDVMRLLSDRSEDLKDFVPGQLEDLIVRAVFGIHCVDEDGVYLLTEIYARQEPTALQYDQIKEWVTGQLSDGWGEALEQQSALQETIYFTKTVFDEDICAFEEEQVRTIAYYHVHAWSSDPTWYLDLVDHNEEELDIPEQESLTELWRIVQKLKERVDNLEAELKKFA